MREQQDEHMFSRDSHMSKQRPHPSTTPLDQWPPAWLKLECSDLLNDGMFIMLHDHEKRAKGLPVTDDEMRAFIREHRNLP